MAAVRLPESSSDRAYLRLAGLIETCQLPPGWHFGNEEEEAAKLGMSRTPFREALQRLEQEGLVRRVAKQRTFVTKIDPAQFRDQMVVRRALEIETLRELFESGAEIPYQEAEALLEEQVAAGTAGDTQRFLHLDPRFHLAMVRWSGNEPAYQLAAAAWRHINRARFLGVPQPGYVETTLAEHRKIVDALRGRSFKALDKAIREHTGASMRRRLEMLRSSYPEAFVAGGAS